MWSRIPISPPAGFSVQKSTISPPPIVVRHRMKNPEQAAKLSGAGKGSASKEVAASHGASCWGSVAVQFATTWGEGLTGRPGFEAGNWRVSAADITPEGRIAEASP